MYFGEGTTDKINFQISKQFGKNQHETLCYIMSNSNQTRKHLRRSKCNLQKKTLYLYVYFYVEMWLQK